MCEALLTQWRKLNGGNFMSKKEALLFSIPNAATMSA
jgi:hypothetical protein